MKKFIKFGIYTLAFLFSVAFISCNRKEKPTDTAGETKKAITYTCPMHPQVIKTEQEPCPICGMDLVPFEKNSSEKGLKIDQKGQVLANIRTAKLDSLQGGGLTPLNGRLVIDPSQIQMLSSRAAGRIENLYVREVGKEVAKGQALYRIYSESLASLQQEYLLALAQEKQFSTDPVARRILAATQQKLRLYGQSEEQIKQLGNRQKVEPYLTFFAPTAGIVAELMVTEGQYVNEGGAIMRLENYNSLWVEADVYADEVKALKLGQQLKVVLNGDEASPQQMKISFINPTLVNGTQLVQIRGSISNRDRKWQPGGIAQVYLPSKASRAAMAIPVDAVIRDAKGAHVWVKTKANYFEPRRVETGQEVRGEVEIIKGLQATDEVVVSGAYLLYSEYLLKKGKNPLD